jgi:hypothetical protein
MAGTQGGTGGRPYIEAGIGTEMQKKALYFKVESFFYQNPYFHFLSEVSLYPVAWFMLAEAGIVTIRVG